MLPHFLCIGAQKAGTSWLYTNLASHPDVWMPPIKELHYFDHLFIPENQKWTSWHIRKGASNSLKWHVNKRDPIDFGYVSYLANAASDALFTEEWYRRLFSRPAAGGKLLGDITPEYSTIPPAGIEYVKALLGPVKIIYIIRDPVARALSQIRMNVERSGFLPQSEEDWLSTALAPEIFNRGDYVNYVQNWCDHFSEEDILFIPYGLIGASPKLFMEKVEKFLAIRAHREYPHLNTVVHKTQFIEIPEFVHSKLTERLESQRGFLANRFGQEFVDKI